MRTLILAFLLTARCALAQLDDVAFVGSLTSGQSVVVTNYYMDATGGSDANDGLSTGAAWKTLSKLGTNLTFGTIKPGHFVLFKRGETFAGSLDVTASGSAGAPITFGAYGTGNLPVIDASSGSYGFRFNSRSYLTFSSITVTGGPSPGMQATTGSKSNIVLNSCVLVGNQTGADIRLVDGLTITGCSFSNSTFAGLNLAGVTNVTITSMISNGNTRQGLAVNASGATTSGGVSVSDSVFCGNGGAGKYNGIAIGGDTAAGYGITISNVLCSTNTGDGFNVAGSWTNVVFDTCIADANGTDGAFSDGDGYSFHNSSSGIIRYSIARDNKKTSIAHINTTRVNHYYNLFYGATNGTQANVLITDTGNHTFYNNVIYSAAQGGTGVSLAGTNTFKNNIVMGFATGILKGTGTLTEDYNCAYGAGTTNYSGFALGANSIQTDPSFANVATRDFTLNAGSPCIDDGVDVGLTRDFAGNPINGTPDMGAYEVQ